MTSVAANIISNTTSAANGASQIATPAGDNGFAAILGGACATPDDSAAANGNVAAGNANAAPGTADTSATQASANQSPDTATLALQEISSGGSKPGSRIDIFGDGAARPTNGARSQPATVSADTPDTATAPTDPILAQLLAAQQAMPAANAPTQASSPATQAAPQTDAAAGNSDPSASLASADVAATSVLAGGASVKSGKPDDNTAPADGEKSQTQATAAAAVADLGKAATRVFTDQRSSAAHALSAPAAAADQPRNNSQSDTSSSGQQNPNSAPNTAPVAAAADSSAGTAVAPTHIQAAPQPDASVNAATATTAPAASASVSAPAQVSAQLHIAHQTAAPDVNALAFNIASKSEGGARHFDIRLDPAELGRVDVRLTVDEAGKAQAVLSVEKPQTLELLQKDQGHLERALKDAGLDLSQNGLSFSLKGQQQQAGGDTATPRGRSHAMRAIAAVSDSASTLSLGSAASSDARLDIRV